MIYNLLSVNYNRTGIIPSKYSDGSPIVNGTTKITGLADENLRAQTSGIISY
jgi:hypothetical protein